MDKLNLPSFNFNISDENGEKKIFDVFRKRFVALTPEEWVRQNLLTWLHLQKGYPSGLILVEAATKYNKLPKRADAIVYGNDGKPKMVVECKAPGIKITQDTFDQAARYNASITATYILISNGLSHYCCRKSEDQWVFLESVPEYVDL